jgi:hypothetical protein
MNIVEFLYGLPEGFIESFRESCSIPLIIFLGVLFLNLHFCRRWLGDNLKECPTALRLGFCLPLLVGQLVYLEHLLLGADLNALRGAPVLSFVTLLNGWMARNSPSPNYVSLPKMGIIILVASILLTCYVMILGTDFDFDHFHFSRLAFIERGVYPAPTYNGHFRAYHDGTYIWATHISLLTGIPPWVAFKLGNALLCTSFVPLIFCISKTLFNFDDKKCWVLTLLTACGVSLRAFFILFLETLKVFIPQDHAKEAFDMILANKHLGSTIFFSLRDDISHAASTLGLPLFFLGFWFLVKAKNFSSKVLFLVCISLGTLGLTREDMLLILLGGIFFVVPWRNFKWNRKLLVFIIGLFLAMLPSLTPGAIPHHKLKNLVTTSNNKPLPSKSSKDQEPRVNTNIPPKLEFSLVPKVGLWNVMNSRHLLPIYHPQVILDVALELSILLSAFIFLLFSKHRESELKLLRYLIGAPLVIILFFDLSGGNQANLQRVLNYNMTCFALTAILLLKGKEFRKGLVFVLIFNQLILLAVLPIRFSKNNQFFKRSHQQLGNSIKEDWLSKNKPPGVVFNLHSGWTALPSVWLGSQASYQGSIIKSFLMTDSEIRRKRKVPDKIIYGVISSSDEEMKSIFSKSQRFSLHKNKVEGYQLFVPTKNIAE